MKKIIFSAALLLAAMTSFAADNNKVQAIAQDTIKFTGTYELRADKKVNDFGETRITYKVVLHTAHDSISGPDKGKTKAISRATYTLLQAGEPLYLVYTEYDDGSERITKVIAGGE